MSIPSCSGAWKCKSWSSYRSWWRYHCVGASARECSCRSERGEESHCLCYGNDSHCTQHCWQSSEWPFQEHGVPSWNCINIEWWHHSVSISILKDSTHFCCRGFSFFGQSLIESFKCQVPLSTFFDAEVKLHNLLFACSSNCISEWSVTGLYWSHYQLVGRCKSYNFRKMIVVRM